MSGNVKIVSLKDMNAMLYMNVCEYYYNWNIVTTTIITQSSLKKNEDRIIPYAYIRTSHFLIFKIQTTIFFNSKDT